MNGNITTISLESGRIIDTEPMSDYCQKCALNYMFKATIKIWNSLAWHENSYMANHKGSARAMQSVGTKRIFRRSIQKHGLRYVKFIRDADSKIFPVAEDIYKGIKVKKLECIDHIQKRVD